MAAMIQNDDEKEWMLPLLELRNELDIPDDRHLRDFRRMDGRVQLFNDRAIPGPYTQESRERWLERLLSAQTHIRRTGPEQVRDIKLITLDELVEIRRIWVYDKHELEDNLPLIYERVVGESFPEPPLEERRAFGVDAIRLLRDVCGDDRLHFEMARELLDVEWRFQTMSRRAGLFGELESALRRGYYEDEDDALERARRRRDAKSSARESVPVGIEITRIAPKD